MKLAELRRHLLAGVVERVARSAEREAFVLRGGLLTAAWVAPLPRPTRDLDFVGTFAWDVAATNERFTRAMATVVDDGIDIAVAGASELWATTPFPGVKLELWLSYAGVNSIFMADIGFNDPLVPPAIDCDFPGTTGRVPVRAVRPETQLAWKLHALAEMGTSWRPKDLHDAWLMCMKVPLDDAQLVPAIVAAFESRGYARASCTGLFDAPHWATKTSRLRWELPRPLDHIVGEVRTRLAPVFAALPTWEGSR